MRRSKHDLAQMLALADGLQGTRTIALVARVGFEVDAIAIPLALMGTTSKQGPFACRKLSRVD
jgi:hypothetical protein